VLAFHSDHFVLPLPAGHSFPSPKYSLLRAGVESSLPDVRLREPPEASDGELALAHEPAWIDAVVHGTTSAAQQREIGFPWTERMVWRARRSVGATIAAARAALIGDEGVACNLAGGTHHAYAHKGAGYCVFNDVAVAARLMQAEWHRHTRRAGQVARQLQVWVIDLDVHQGNGTAAIFRDDPSVFTLSIHAARNFPFRKEASSLDIELPDGCADESYLQAVDQGLRESWRLQAGRPPQLAFYLAGADPHEDDRLGRLAVTRAGLAERDRRVLDFLEQRSVPVALSMAGGYGRELQTTVDIHLHTVTEAMHSWHRRQAGRSSSSELPQAAAHLS
jgi:acetoin utilization deacetylase AcuC-like enzyme